MRAEFVVQKVTESLFPRQATRGTRRAPTSRPDCRLLRDSGKKAEFDGAYLSNVRVTSVLSAQLRTARVGDKTESIAIAGTKDDFPEAR
jgi:hypothetical protein